MSTYVCTSMNKDPNKIDTALDTDPFPSAQGEPEGLSIVAG